MAQPRYYGENDLAERQPLGDPAASSPRHYQFQHQQQHFPPHEQRDHQQPPNASPPRHRPAGAHPDSAFDGLQAQRRWEQGRGQGSQGRGAGGDFGAAAVSPPQPPAHRGAEAQHWGQDTGYPPRRPLPHSNITPGADNFSNAAAGGMTGIAMTVAEQRARESGMNAAHDPYSPPQQQRWSGQGYGNGERQHFASGNHDQAQGPFNDVYSADAASSRSSLPRTIGGPSGMGTPGHRTPSRSPHALGGEIYTDDPYQSYSRQRDAHLGIVNPNDIEDDGDDGLSYARKSHRTSMLSLGSSHRGREGAATAAGGAAAGGLMAGMGSRNGSGDLNGHYAPVYHGAGEGLSGGASGNLPKFAAEKSDWEPDKPKKWSGKRWRLLVIIVFGVLALAGLICGILFGVVLKNIGGGPGAASGPVAGSTSTAEGDRQANGDINATSSEIQALLNNPNLHKVFPGIDYTPINTQYPECLKFPPSQNNITRDIAVMSQLTNTIRLYGTDCNQTEMVLHAIDQLKLRGQVKVWLGVWQDANTTTNARQLRQMWDILDNNKKTYLDYFRGVIVANEILFREQMTITQLGSLLSEVRTNLTRRGISLPVATSDLGDKWDSTLASQSDAIMGNIHPFFAGTPAGEAADWTMYFWGNKTGTFLKSNKKMNIISEIGWPSQGGMGCGNAFETNCPQKSVAGTSEMNTLLEDWVCRALEEGTEYFWFSAFDEPWKIRFNEPGKEWEDHWGLFDVNRNLKPGVKIPDCGGQRVTD